MKLLFLQNILSVLLFSNLTNIHRNLKHIDQNTHLQTLYQMGSGGGSVGGAVASDTRDPWFESQHW